MHGHSRAALAARLLPIAVLTLLAGCGRQATPEEQRQSTDVHELRGPTMGSYYVVKYVGGAEPGATRTAIEAVLAEHDRCFSLWREDSEIAAFNRHRERTPFAASATFRSVLATALNVAARTGGAFDPTIQPLTRLYRRQKQGQGEATAAELGAARTHVDYRHVHLTPAGVVKDDPELELDLDGIVAGACADALAARLRALGVRGAMLQVTGEVLCFGEKAPGVPWQIGIEAPADDDQRLVTTLPLRDVSLCTSGSYRDHVDAGGAKRHHILDPRTGENAPHHVVSVSVLARSCAVADALATALMVLGAEDAEALLRDWPAEPDLAALFVVDEGKGTATTRRVRWPAPG